MSIEINTDKNCKNANCHASGCSCAVVIGDYNIMSCCI